MQQLDPPKGNLRLSYHHTSKLTRSHSQPVLGTLDPYENLLDTFY